MLVFLTSEALSAGRFNERIRVDRARQIFVGTKVRVLHIHEHTQKVGCRFNSVRELTENLKSPCSPDAPRTIRGEGRAEVEGVLEAQTSVLLRREHPIYRVAERIALKNLLISLQNCSSRLLETQLLTN